MLLFYSLLSRVLYYC